MKQVIVAVALATLSSTSMAAGIARGNIDLDDWVVEYTPKSSAAVVAETSGSISRNNSDLYGWVVESNIVASSTSVKSQRSSISQGNVDLDNWVVADVMAE